VAEGVAIVLSILLAFGIQAAWDARTERMEIREALETLLAEFGLHHTGLQENLILHHLYLDSGLRLLSIATGSVPLPPDQVMDSLLYRVFVNASSFNASHGALDALVASGQLGSLQNVELRSLLASWPGLLRDSVEDEEYVFRDVQERLTPFINSRIATRNIFAADGSGSDLPRRTDSADLSRLLSDVEFDNLVSYRVLSERIMIGENQRLEAAINRIISLIESEL
jgi:hypothetical protein